MKRITSIAVLSVLLAATISSCGSSDGDVGAEACEIYADELKDSPEAITSMFALPKIKEILDEADDTTRRAFAALITANESNPFSSTTDPNAVYEAAADVRTACLSEHSIEVPAP